MLRPPPSSAAGPTLPGQNSNNCSAAASFNPMITDGTSDQLGFLQVQGFLNNKRFRQMGGVSAPDGSCSISSCGSSKDGSSDSGSSGVVSNNGSVNSQVDLVEALLRRDLEFRNLLPVSNQKLHVSAFTPASSESSELYEPVSKNQNCEVSSVFPTLDLDMMSSTLEGLVQSSSQLLQENCQPLSQPYGQLDKPLEVEELCHLNKKDQFGRQLAGQMVRSHSRLPSGQSYATEHSENPLTCSSSATRSTNAGEALPYFIEQKILHAYVKLKSSMINGGDCLVPFVNHLHSTVCKNRTCMCEQYWFLLSHFDDCQDDDCHSCAPVRGPCTTDRLWQNCENMNSDHAGSFNKDSRADSHCIEDILPPAKRLKMEIPCPLSSESGIVLKLDPMFVEVSNTEALPALQHWPESPLSVRSEVMDANIEMLKEPISSPVCSKNMGSSEECNVGCKSQGTDSRSVSELADCVKSDSNESRSHASLAFSAECSVGSIEVIPVTSNTKVAMPDSDIELHTRGAKPDGKPMPQTAKIEAKSENSKIRGVSLIEFWTSKQIIEHISSLQQWIGQRILKEDKENRLTHTVTDSQCQLCTANKLLLAPVPIYCSCCSARIKRSVIYYSTSEENGLRHCFCTACYKESRGGSITFYGLIVPKSKLEKKKNDQEIEEPWVQCDKCKHWQHQICALFNCKRDTEGKAEYICPNCCLEEIENTEGITFSKAPFVGAKDLPTTMLSDYIEKRLLSCLQQEREERAKNVGKNLDEVPRAEDLIVRVVLSVNKQLKVKQQFLEIFHDENYPAEFPYRSKVILLFQNIEGVDVCLFGMYVQEYGSECSPPNQRCVYISYLDSVKYFRPQRETAMGEALRTFVYHQILIGYLEYCKKRGFATCHLWACPPVKGEDYILYCHPEVQKTPKSDKLRQWYHSMLKKAVKENIVVNFTNLYDHFFVPTAQSESKISATRLPYFDGDYWSGIAEKVIKNVELLNGGYSGRKAKKAMTKRTLKAMGHTNPSDDDTKDILLMQKMGQMILPVKEDFIVVHLQFVCTHCHEVMSSGCRWSCSQCKNFQLCERCHEKAAKVNGENIHVFNGKEKHLLSKVMVDDLPSDTEDKDVTIENWLFENRHTFLGFCQRNHYQFDTLRRAKHSSMMILHYLHNPMQPTLETTCNICHQDTNSKDIDVCAACYHKKVGSSRASKSLEYSSPADCGTKSKDGKPKTHMQKELLDVLEHASQCQSTNSDPCSFPNCLKIKRLFFHARKCTTRVPGGCLHCRKVWFVLTLHSRVCTQTNCGIPRCRDLRKHAATGDLVEDQLFWIDPASTSGFRSKLRALRD